MSTRKEEFRQTIESNGLIDTLTRILTSLYEEPERPEKPLEFLMQELGAKSHEKLTKENKDLQQKVKALKKEIKNLKSKISKYGGNEDESEESEKENEKENEKEEKEEKEESEEEKEKEKEN
ncbi:c-myc-binding protein [Anaeramoeba flamelloides]|uniref:C-myc-binding protein n=1 Tax=Anaeramoeba flamelloides TaxID=1746091 RepID=A0ABQ8X7T0_9EUKA|nr:c-myc-binding protein [Anaeramoeba flamelloides]